MIYVAVSTKYMVECYFFNAMQSNPIQHSTFMFLFKRFFIAYPFFKVSMYLMHFFYCEFFLLKSFLCRFLYQQLLFHFHFSTNAHCASKTISKAIHFNASQISFYFKVFEKLSMVNYSSIIFKARA